MCVRESVDLFDNYTIIIIIVMSSSQSYRSRVLPQPNNVMCLCTLLIIIIGFHFTTHPSPSFFTFASASNTNIRQVIYLSPGFLWHDMTLLAWLTIKYSVWGVNEVQNITQHQPHHLQVCLLLWLFSLFSDSLDGKEERFGSKMSVYIVQTLYRMNIITTLSLNCNSLSSVRVMTNHLYIFVNRNLTHTHHQWIFFLSLTRSLKNQEIHFFFLKIFSKRWVNRRVEVLDKLSIKEKAIILYVLQELARCTFTYTLQTPCSSCHQTTLIPEFPLRTSTIFLPSNWTNSLDVFEILYKIRKFKGK